MAKSKFDPKDFLLRRGEVLVMGLAGFFLLVLMVWGVRASMKAMNPDAEAKKLDQQAKSINDKIATGEPDEKSLKDIALPPWIKEKTELKTAPSADFLPTGQYFDPTAQPSTKRDNPIVFPIGEYQVDLIRAAMPGYDLRFNDQNEPLIAVITTKSESKPEEAKLKKYIAELAARAKQHKDNQNNLSKPPINTPAPMGNNPMGGFPPAKGGTPPMMGGMGRGGPGGMYSNPHGLLGGEFDQQGQRPAIEYIRLKELDAAVRAGKAPALTVIPLRMVTVHAVVPYKKQLDEIKRALRLPNPPATAKADEIARSDEEARKWGPWYDGYEVQRKVTKMKSDGTFDIIQDWPEKPLDPTDLSGNYKFEEMYIDKIETRKLADSLDEGYLPYFLKPEMMLTMPLPALAKDLNVKYPEVTLKDIVDNIEKLKKADKKEPTPSELLQRLSANPDNKKKIYHTTTADAAEGLGVANANKFGALSAPGGMLPGGGLPNPGGVGGPKAGAGDSSHVDGVDNYLLRFIDCDVKPGYTYEYRIRLRMTNPNFGQDGSVANPEFAKESYKLLYSKWLQLENPITVPAESFLYAYDTKTYRDQINAAYPNEGKEATAESKALNGLLQVKDYQAVVEIATWMEQVKAGEGSNREPVGAWVVAEIPVGRGEYIGRKQYVKLPLWSSELQQYVLRELNDKVVKGKYQPKGWLVDFSTKSVLVDFDGGRVKTKSSVRFDAQGNLVTLPRSFDEDVDTELLIVRPDGKLVVRGSLADGLDPNRKTITGEWARWVKDVENRKPATGGEPGQPNQFDPKKPNSGQ